MRHATSNRRHRGLAAIVALGLTLAVSVSAVAQTGGGTAGPKKGTAASGSATTGAAASAAPTGATGTAPSGTTGTAPSGTTGTAPSGTTGAAASGTTGAAASGAPGTAAASSSAGASTPVAVPPPAAPSGDKGVDGATYAVRLRDLEARVDELKDQIRRSHTRLALLSDTILSGGAAGSRAEIGFANEMSSAFRLTRALVVLDGAVQYNRADDTGALADQKEIPVFSGSVPPGDHTVQVLLNFQGNGYGVFTYLRGYKFEVKSSHSFTAVEGKTLALTATALEKGGVTTPLEQRPAIEWHEKVQSLGGAGAAPVAAPAPGAPPAGTAGGGNK
jgi:hypothetical protein